MSLINQMLADLEARKGGRLQRVDAALDGLHAAPLRVVTERPRAMLGALVVFGACAALWTSRAPLSDFLRLSPAPSLMRVASEPAAPVPAPSVTAPVREPPPAPLQPVVVLEPAPADTLAPAHVDIVLPPATLDVLPLEPALPLPLPDATPPPVVAKPAPAPVPVSQTPADLASIYLDADGNEVARADGDRAAPRALPSIAAPDEAHVEHPGSFRRDQATAPAVTPAAHRLAEIDAMFANGERERALQALRGFVLSMPADVSAREKLALALIAERRLTEAEAVLRAGLRLVPDSARLAAPLGHLLLAQNRVDAALNVLRPAAPPLADHPDFHALLAAAEQRAGAHGLAITRYRGLLKEQPLNGSWLVALGISLLAVDERGDAEATFARALDDRSLAEPLRAYATRELVRLKEAGR